MSNLLLLGIIIATYIIASIFIILGHEEVIKSNVAYPLGIILYCVMFITIITTGLIVINNAQNITIIIPSIIFDIIIIATIIVVLLSAILYDTHIISKESAWMINIMLFASFFFFAIINGSVLKHNNNVRGSSKIIKQIIIKTK
jgi:hypothetical protein